MWLLSHVTVGIVIWVVVWFLRTFVLPLCVLSERRASKRVRSYMHTASAGSRLVPDKPFAIVTGANGSIGAAFAEYLARHGYSLILAGRSPEALEVTAKKLAETYPSIVIVTERCNLSDSESIHAFVKAIETRDIAVLVNNAGTVNVLPDDVVDLSEDCIKDIMAVNVQGTVLLTRLLLPKLKNRKNCLIMFMGSINGSLPCPMVTCYSATKAFTHAFATALREELSAAAITVVAAAPAWIASSMTLRKRTSLLFISPEHFVRCLFRACWMFTVVNPYYWHSVMESLMRLAPECLLLKYQYAQLTNMRGKIEKKLKKEK